jgi:hypothetical protein
VGEEEEEEIRMKRLGQEREHGEEDSFYSKCNSEFTEDFKKILQNLYYVDNIPVVSYFSKFWRLGGF